MDHMWLVLTQQAVLRVRKVSQGPRQMEEALAQTLAVRKLQAVMRVMKVSQVPKEEAMSQMHMLVLRQKVTMTYLQCSAPRKVLLRRLRDLRLMLLTLLLVGVHAVS